MGNIVGNNPDQEIGLQIKIRQGALGASERNTDILNWIASSTPFIRLTSCVSISEKKCKELGIDSTKYSGMGLAKAMVLLGGVWSEDQVGVDGSSPFKAGVRNTNDNKIINNFAFGFGGDSFGLAPPPGIESLDVEFMNRGSIKKSRLKLKVNSIEQLKLIETLYLRMGFNVLVEYGHSVYINNEAQYVTSTGLNTAYQMLVGKDSDPLNNYTQYEIQQAIEADKRVSCGNYDAFLGRVTNFNWGFDDKGAFDVSLEVFSIGDVAESFKMNVPGTTKVITSFKDIPLTGDTSVNSKIGTYANLAISALKETNKTKQQSFYQIMAERAIKWKDPSFSIDDLKQKITTYKASPYSTDGKISSKGNYTCTSMPAILSSPFLPFENVDNIREIENQEERNEASRQSYKDNASLEAEKQFKSKNAGYLSVKDKNGKTQYYITLRELLRFIEAQCLIYDDATLAPILRIDTSIENFCYTHPYQLSTNPAVCLISGRVLTESSRVNLNSSSENAKTSIIEGKNAIFRSRWLGAKIFEDVVKNAFREPVDLGTSEYGGDPGLVDSPYIGSLLDIWVNLELIKNFSTKTEAKDPDVTLYAFLSNLMAEIQYSLGNVNKFDVTFSTEESTIKITETLPLKDYIELGSQTSFERSTNTITDYNAVTFNIYGFSPTGASSVGWDNGSFVTSMKFDAKISNSMRAMVVASSAGGGNNTGTANTAFSRWNEGLTDVLLSKKSPEGEELISGEEEGAEKVETKESTWYFSSDKFNKYMEEVSISDRAAAQYYLLSNSNLILGNSDDSKKAQKATTESVSAFIRDFADFVSNFVDPPAANPEGYLPLTLSLSFKGLSGLKNYDKIYINENVLPPNYPKNLGFIIKGIKHKVNDKGWETDIDCMSFGVPKGIQADHTQNEYYNTSEANRLAFEIPSDQI